MLWWLEHGENAEQIRDQAERNKMPLPDFLENQPEVAVGLDYVWQAFWDLSSCRSGEGMGPIAWTAINEYAKRYELIGWEYDRFLMLIRSMDTEFLDHRHKMMKRKSRR